jgi:hypothetical protein
MAAGGFFSDFSFGDAFDGMTGLAGKYFEERYGQKQNEATGAAQQELVNGSVEGISNPNAVPTSATPQNQSGGFAGFQLDQKTMLIGGGALVALILLLKR